MTEYYLPSTSSPERLDRIHPISRQLMLQSDFLDAEDAGVFETESSAYRAVQVELTR